jgi:mono/diheme cytochrome c family protein
LPSPYLLNKIAAVAIIFFGALIALEILPAQAPPSVWDGIYTQEQAKRGEAAYLERCARCHKTDLSSADTVPALSGTDFLSTWNTKTVGDIFDRIRTTMPSDKPGTLTRQQDSDILSYILSFNKFPAGSTELGTQSQLFKQIQFDAFRQ